MEVLGLLLFNQRIHPYLDNSQKKVVFGSSFLVSPFSNTTRCVLEILILNILIFLPQFLPLSFPKLRTKKLLPIYHLFFCCLIHALKFHFWISVTIFLFLFGSFTDFCFSYYFFSQPSDHSPPPRLPDNIPFWSWYLFLFLLGFFKSTSSHLVISASWTAGSSVCWICWHSFMVVCFSWGP